jgi:hypothetical protein
LATAIAQEALTPEQAAANLARHQRARKEASPATADDNRKPAASSTVKAAGHRKGDRWAVYNGFVDHTLRELSEAELRVWLILFRDVRDGLARAGMTDIARRAGLSRRGVVKAVAGLKHRRLIEVAVRGSVNGSTNAYRVYGARPSEP